MLNLLEDTPAFQRWNVAVSDAQQDAWYNYQAYVMRVDHALSLIDVLWPDFILRDGLILRTSSIPPDWESFIVEARVANWTSCDIEYVVNHIHIPDLFLNDPDRDQIVIEVFQYIADVIAETWKCRLCVLYPDRKFSVTVNDYDVSPEVGVCTLR